MKNAKKCRIFGTTYVLKMCVHSVTAGFQTAGGAKVKKGIMLDSFVVAFLYTRGTLVVLFKFFELLGGVVGKELFLLIVTLCVVVLGGDAVAVSSVVLLRCAVVMLVCVVGCSLLVFTGIEVTIGFSFLITNLA